MLTPETTRNPSLKSGFHGVARRRRADGRWEYRAQWGSRPRERGAHNGSGWGSWGLDDGRAAQDYCDYINGLPPQPTVTTHPDLSPRPRPTVTSTSTRGESWPSPLYRGLVARAGGACEKCRIRNWRGQPVRLHADHIDQFGNHSMENGQMLCGNCNAEKNYQDAQERARRRLPTDDLQELT